MLSQWQERWSADLCKVCTVISGMRPVTCLAWWHVRVRLMSVRTCRLSDAEAAKLGMRRGRSAYNAEPVQWDMGVSLERRCRGAPLPRKPNFVQSPSSSTTLPLPRIEILRWRSEVPMSLAHLQLCLMQGRQARRPTLQLPLARRPWRGPLLGSLIRQSSPCASPRMGTRSAPGASTATFEMHCPV